MSTAEVKGEYDFPQLRGKTGITLKEYEKILIVYTLNHVGGNKSKAADILGIERKTLYNKLKEYGLHT